MPEIQHNRGPFDVLGLAPRFDLKPDEIERAYLARAGALHPDLASGNAETADRAARGSAALNDARRVLRDAERRAGVLLELLGGPGKSEDKSLPDGFLMEILETREEVESARDSGDPERIAQWEAWAGRERERYIEVVSGLFRALGETPGPESLREIRTQLNAWRYIERLIEQLDPEYDPARADLSD